MTTRITATRAAVVSAALAGLAALSLTVAASAVAGSRSASTVSVVGAGTLERSRVPVLARPRDGAKQVAVIAQFRPDFRLQYVLALDVVRTKKGAPAWYRISVPGRPNGRTGWVRARAVDLHPVYKRLVIYRDSRRFEFWSGNRLLRAGKVAVGKPGAETPLGLFYVTWKFDPSIDPTWAILGAYAFETSAYSKLTEWPGGGVVGIHGTSMPQLLGQAVSHGCVRVANVTAAKLKRYAPLGTPISITR